MGDGVLTSNEAGESLKHIVESVDDVTAMVQQIALAAEEQSATGDEIVSNLETVASITKQTAEEVQGSCNSIKNLNSLTFELQQFVSEFTLKSGNANNESSHRSINMQHTLNSPADFNIPQRG